LFIVRKVFSVTMLALLLANTLTLAFNVGGDESVHSSTATTGQQAGILSEAPPTEWTRAYGGANEEHAYSVVQTGDGGYALAGETLSYGGGSVDFWLVKTDSSGNMLWSRTYGGSGGQIAYSMIRTSDGGFALAGYTSETPNFIYDFWLVKTDAAGNQLWSKTYGGLQNDVAYSVVQTSDGGYAVAGVTNAYSGSGAEDALLVKTDSSGNMMWSKTYGGANADGAYSIVQVANGGYAIAGFTLSYGVGGFWLVKTDADGNILWSNTYGGPGAFACSSLVLTGDGGYALAGDTQYPTVGYLLVKADSSGNMLWSKTFATDAPYKCSLIQTTDGGYGLAAQIGFDDPDFWFVKTDATGGTMWDATYGGTAGDGATSIIQTSDGGYALAGHTYSYGAGSADFWLVKVGATSVSITDEEKQQDILNMVNNHRGVLSPGLVLGVIRTEAGVGAFHVDGWNYNSFYREADGSWAQPTNGDGIMQVTSASGYHEKSGTYTNDQEGNDHAINDGCNYLLNIYYSYGSCVQTVLHYNTGPSSLYIYLGLNWGCRTYLSNVAKQLTSFVPDTYGLQNPSLANTLNKGQGILNKYLYNKGIMTGQSVDYYRSYQKQLDGDLRNIELSPLALETGQRISVFGCPVNVTITDNYSRIISETENQIPEASFEYLNATDTKIFFTPSNLTYQVQVNATDYGNCTVGQITPADSVYETAFSEITFNLTDETDASFDLSPYEANYTLEVDEDGDGSIDYELPPEVWIMTTEYDIGITEVAPSKTDVGQGYSLPINITVLNYGAYTETLNLTLYANATFIELQTITLTNGTSTTLTFTWNTTGFAKGNYTLWSYAEPVQGETFTSDNNSTDGWVTVTILGDVNGDFKCEGKDIAIIAKAYGTRAGEAGYVPNADINDDGRIDGKDIAVSAKYYGTHYP